MTTVTDKSEPQSSSKEPGIQLPSGEVLSRIQSRSVELNGTAFVECLTVVGDKAASIRLTTEQAKHHIESMRRSLVVALEYNKTKAEQVVRAAPHDGVDEGQAAAKRAATSRPMNGAHKQ